ncbi:MAG: hypothetical protein QXE81_05075 [Desulfurococcaceae archaeon]
MACFITPLSIGLLIKVIRRFLLKELSIRFDALETMLIGGSLVLMIEHILNGEIVAYPPFLTAASSPEYMPILIREITIVGGSMTIAVVATWIVVFAISRSIHLNIYRFVRLVSTLKKI